jgi:glycosyltransferase involved in cell wall biosynthesis
MASAIESIIPSVHDKLRIAPMPADDAVFTGAVRNALNPVTVILCVTRHTVQKRNAVLIRALAQLQKSGRKFQCRLVGDGGSERESLVGLIAELGLRDSVSLIPSMLQDELAQEYRNADVTVLPAVDEGFGLALIEAQLCDCPVIGSRSGGITDIILEGKTGLWPILMILLISPKHWAGCLRTPS